MFENYLEVIQSLHREATSPWHWPTVAAAPPPEPAHHREHAARAALQAYRPGLLDRLLGRDDERIRLEALVDEARSEDAREHQAAIEQWQWYAHHAAGVLAGQHAAFYAVVNEIAAFDDLEDLGTRIEIVFTPTGVPEVTLTVTDPEIVPREELKLLASGKTSSKAMPQSRYWLLYQDHVCSAAIRAARELFALLPSDAVFVHVFSEGLNSATGHNERTALLSVVFDRMKFSQVNFERIDPSDCVSQFTHRMQFKKTTGFSKIEPLSPHGMIEARA